ncbi:MAG TPA: DNA polymerase III subunit gamma/tau [Thermoanaerobaculia bacterium]|nr:DNA polymerase III subunit gamma/tau [Thermoanaerobaculia bacterium]
MSYQALARKYRPQTFRDIIGQETVVRTLQNAIRENRIHHAYLFSGVRGVGKTTTARILAKALNCVKGPAAEPCNECTICREITEGIDLDVREIDAATYTGVDNVRELRDVTQFQPARDRFRTFIIDEAHMLSGASWNALLKLIEEPPPHVVFMFATTEMHKVPQTILSRVQKFALRKITLDELIARLEEIGRAEDIRANRDALEIIARRGEGSVRDSLSLLDQIIAFSGRSISAADVATVLGLSDTSFFARLVSLIGEGDHAGVIEALQEAGESGRDFKLLYRDLLAFVRNLLLLAGGADPSLTGASPDDLPAMRATAETFSYSELLRIANLLLKDDEVVRNAEHQRLAVEIALLKAATFPRLRAIEEVLTREGAGREVRTAEVPRREAPRPDGAKREARDTSGGDDLAALVERIRKSKPLIASYIEQARSGKKNGSRIEWVFTDPFYADAMTDSKQTVEKLAAELYGEPVTVEIRSEASAGVAGRPAQTSPLRDDPVVKAFAKHLGGEVIEPRKR